MTDHLGSALRDARLAKDLRLVDVSSEAGLTAGHLSLIDRGKATPSVGALNRICQVLGLRMGQLFLDDELPDPSLPSAGQALVRIVKSNQRRVITLPESGIRHELVSPDLQHAMEVFRTQVPRGAGSGEVPLAHAGEECILVLTGTMVFHLGEQNYILEDGDAVYFDAGNPHSWRNAGEGELELIWVATPPHF